MSGTTAASGWAHLGSRSMLGVAGAPPWASWPVDPRVVVPSRVYVQMWGRQPCSSAHPVRSLKLEARLYSRAKRATRRQSTHGLTLMSDTLSVLEVCNIS